MEQNLILEGKTALDAARGEIDAGNCEAIEADAAARKVQVVELTLCVDHEGM